MRSGSWGRTRPVPSARVDTRTRQTNSRGLCGGSTPHAGSAGCRGKAPGAAVRQLPCCCRCGLRRRVGCQPDSHSVTGAALQRSRGCEHTVADVHCSEPRHRVVGCDGQPARKARADRVASTRLLCQPAHASTWKAHQLLKWALSAKRVKPSRHSASRAR